MKKFLLPLVATVAVVGLTACGDKGKTGWTAEEKDIFEDMLYEELPFASGLTIDEDLSDDAECLIALGGATNLKGVDAYVSLLENKGYTELDIDPEQALDEIFEYDFDTVSVFAKYFSKSGYIPYYGNVVAVGLEDGTNKLAVVAAPSRYMQDEDFLSSGGLYNKEQSGFDLLELWNVEYYPWWLLVGNADDSTTEEEIEERQKNFVAYESEECSALNITDYGYALPFTMGNQLSSSWQPGVQFYLAGNTEDEHNAFIDALEAKGYEAKVGTSYTIYTLEQTEGTYVYIDYGWDAEFWEMSGGAKDSGCTFVMTFWAK